MTHLTPEVGNLIVTYPSHKTQLAIVMCILRFEDRFSLPLDLQDLVKNHSSPGIICCKIPDNMLAKNISTLFSIALASSPTSYFIVWGEERAEKLGQRLGAGYFIPSTKFEVLKGNGISVHRINRRVKSITYRGDKVWAKPRITLPKERLLLPRLSMENGNPTK
jgi:hypothetical protein